MIQLHKKMDQHQRIIIRFVYLLSIQLLLLLLLHATQINCDYYSDLSECNFKTRDCNWTLSNGWQWQLVQHDYRSLQLNSTPYSQGKIV